MTKIGFLFSTVDGHTVTICERLKAQLEAEGVSASLIELTPDVAADIGQYDRIVIGASIRYGKHRPEVARFVEQNRAQLEASNSAFFSVNAVARKAENPVVDSAREIASSLGV